MLHPCGVENVISVVEYNHRLNLSFHMIKSHLYFVYPTFVYESPCYEIHQMEMHLFNLIKTVNRRIPMCGWKFFPVVDATQSFHVYIRYLCAVVKNGMFVQALPFVSLKNIKIRYVNSLSIMAMARMCKMRTQHNALLTTHDKNLILNFSYPLVSSSHRIYEEVEKMASHKFEWHLSFIEWKFKFQWNWQTINLFVCHQANH